MLERAIEAFGLDKKPVTITPICQGLINHSWKVKAGGEEFVLQQINEHVFKQPAAIAHNIALISDYLQEHQPGYYFTSPVKAVNGEQLVHIDGGYFRLFPFVKNSHSINVVQTPEQAYEAAAQFGKFTASLSGFDPQQLKITIPHFHDLSVRYADFLDATKKGDPQRLKEGHELIQALLALSVIVEEFEEMKQTPGFLQRVTHHDTKISNVLFDDKGKGICVIDLDTVMPGYFTSDVGDMMRTYLCPVNEEETDLSAIEIRKEYFEAIVNGYLLHMQHHLSGTEAGYFQSAGKFMIYMQALRFLTDYLNGDKYYQAAHPQHNLIRAKNQFVLLQQFQAFVNEVPVLP